MTVRTLTQRDLDGFAQVSGDDNPIHTDPQYAAGTPFELPVAHGMYLLSLVRTELESRWPRHRLGSLELMFPTPSPVGAQVDVVVDEAQARPVDGGEEIAVSARIRKSDGSVGLEGRFVLVPGGDL